MKKHGDTFPPIKCTQSEEKMRKRFTNGFGISKGCPFTAWGENYVYFPTVYDGMEWISCVPRNPCDTHTYHIGRE